MLQPVVVRERDGGYELVVGERRWRAARLAGRATLPAVVKDVASPDLLELALVENVQRHDLNPIELALAFRALADAGATQEEVGRRVGVDRSTVANHLRLLELPRELQADVEEGAAQRGPRQGAAPGDEPRAPPPAPRPHRRERASRCARRRSSPASSPDRARPSAQEPAARRADPDLEQLLGQLREALQTKVRISGTARRGKLEVEYYGAEELHRITRDHPRGAPMSSDRIAAAPTVIDAGASFEGLLTFRGSARVDGDLSGRVVADGCLVIGPRGRVDRDHRGGRARRGRRVRGRGDRALARVELLASGRVTGRLRAPSFSLAEGCLFDGQWETVVPRSAARPRRSPEVAAGPLAGPGRALPRLELRFRFVTLRALERPPISWARARALVFRARRLRRDPPSGGEEESRWPASASCAKPCPARSRSWRPSRPPPSLGGSDPPDVPGSRSSRELGPLLVRSSCSSRC